MIIKNIGLLVGIVPAGVLRKEGAAMDETGMLRDAWLQIDNGRITDFGTIEGSAVSGTPRRCAPLRPLPSPAASSLRDNLHSTGPSPYTCPGVDTSADG